MKIKVKKQSVFALGLAAAVFTAFASIVPETLLADGAARYRSTEQEFSTMQIGEDIDYVSREKTEYKMVMSHPGFATSSYAGSCAAIAGSNVLGYFDRYYEELIPNHEAGEYFLSAYLYNYDDKYVREACDELFIDMVGSNVNQGATEKQFKDGMAKYCNSKGRTFSYSSCMSGGSLSLTKVYDAFAIDKPVVLFLRKYNVTQYFEPLETRDHYSYYDSEVSHVMVAFGYTNFFYTLSSGTRWVRMLHVASCNALVDSKGFYVIDRNPAVVDAIAVTIA